MASLLRRLAGCLAVAAWECALDSAETACFASPAAEQGPRQVVRIRGPHLQIGFDERDGSLLEFDDLKTGRRAIDPRDAAAQGGGLWEIRLRKGNENALLAPGQAKVFRIEAIAGEPVGRRLVWEQFGPPCAPQLKVEVVVRLDAEGPTSRWSIAASRLAGSTVDEIHFPSVRGIARQDREHLALPVWMGQQAAEPRRWFAGTAGPPQRREWSYPGPLSMQCVAYYQRRGLGLYVACDDTASRRKTFAVQGDAQGRIGLEWIHYPQGEADRSTAGIDYSVLLGTFCGDWFTVAERYRVWALRQPWAKESRLKRGLVPDWVLQTGLWVWNRGRSPGVLPPAVALRERLGLPVSVFWHWWHGCAYDTGFPEYFPPREGAEAFRSALAAAHGKDVRALVYMNQRLWGTTTKSWLEERAAQFAVKDRNGKIAPEVYNIFTKQPCAAMCMGTPFWRDKYAGLAERAVRELGVDGIYMDQACLSAPCYDRSHGHPLGSGSFWTDGFRMLAEDIRRRVRGPRSTALAGEGCGETWLGDLDLMLSLQVSHERYAGQDGWETIPFFHAVYHPLTVLYGNYSSLTAPPYDDLWPAKFAPESPLALLDPKFSRQFRLEQARAFVWGQQPTIANFLPEHFETRRDEIAYVMRLARVRSRSLKYLLHGTLLRQPAIDVPQAEIDFSRLSIYAGREGGITSFRKSCPTATIAAWRAPDGAVGVALASIADRDMGFALPLDRAAYGLPQRGSISRIDENGRSVLGPFDADGPSVEIRLPAHGACVIEFSGP